MGRLSGFMASVTISSFLFPFVILRRIWRLWVAWEEMFLRSCQLCQLNVQNVFLGTGSSHSGMGMSSKGRTRKRVQKRAKTILSGSVQSPGMSID